MGKKVLQLSTFLLTFLLLCSNSIFADKGLRKSDRKNVIWMQQSFAPDLYLQPYFEVKLVAFSATASCPIQALPFWEGFNKDSTTLNCWTIVDANLDATAPTGNNIWKVYDVPNGAYEGNRSMYFYGGPQNDDWLISPTFKLDASKLYKFKYHYKANNAVNEMEVLASTKGIASSDFTTTVVAKRSYSNTDWVEEKIYINNLGGDVNLSWHITSAVYGSLSIDNMSIEEVACMEPENLAVKGLKTTQATIFWNDPVNAAWEYAVVTAGGNVPVGGGTPTLQKEVIITTDQSNKALTANTRYDYYIRAKCDSGKFGQWIGPFSFKTLCNSTAIPYTEGFNTTSAMMNCWTELDGNKDKLPTGANAWRQYNITPFDGDRSIFFQSTVATANHNDWLISPALKMTGGIYAITYYYKTAANNDNEFEVLLSQDGIDVPSFTTVLEASKKRNAVNYVKKVLYVQNITADVHIAWHAVGKGASTIYLDLITVEAVSCLAPDDNIVVSKIEKDKATFSWTDGTNTGWEYYVQPMNAAVVPVGSGRLAANKTIDVTQISGNGSVSLQPNSWYDFFVRSNCGPGKTSLWVGPIAFKTACDTMTLPFWEGFNSTSTNLACWTMVDNNKDSTSPTNNIFYTAFRLSPFEGDQSMMFNGAVPTTKHDDWLISPTFNLVSSKFYRLRYHYKTTTANRNDFEVLLSNKGTVLSEFTKKLTSKKNHSDSNWVEETAIIGGISGNINIAWHVTTEKSASSFGLDNVFLEEIVGCPEPMNLGVNEEKQTSANLYWTDDFGGNWEYVVQKAGGSKPTAVGTATNKKENTVTKDFAGNNLVLNTAYEFYVRTICGDGTQSIWMGPFKFRTTCGLYNTPFWEGFNANSTSVNCWTIIDQNNDSASATSSNIWKTTTTNFEGTHMMFFFGNATDNSKLPHNDWLVSPVIKMDISKKYRLKYHYKTLATANIDYEFEVLLSNSGTDTKNFNKLVVSKNKYAPLDVWKEEYVFISGVGGDVNLAWHVTSASAATYIYIDNIFVEEVMGCPEPLKLNAKDITSNTVTLSWTDEFNASAWEHYIQEVGKGLPIGKGTLSSTKEVVASKEQSGKNLEPNSDYEYYVRSSCGNGAYSIWSGPYKFATACATFAVPFFEGFNSQSKTTRCWTIVNDKGEIIPAGTTWRLSNNSMYEGNQTMFYNLNIAKKEPYNDWLISPTLTLDGGMYVLKYHYKTTTTANINNEFEVLLSKDGLDISKFTHVLVSSNNYRIGNYVEEVVFISGIQGEVNIAWHVKSKDTNSSTLYLDNIKLNKVEGCPEPYHVKLTNETATAVDVDWKQDGGITAWEVIAVEYGKDATATAVKTIAVTTNPKTTISGLDPGKSYTIYVRAKCADGKSMSNWSTPIHWSARVGANDDCGGAINIPVNGTLECVKTVSGTLYGATKSTTPLPQCANYLINDVWFEFTATATSHLLSLNGLTSLSGSTATPTVSVAIYDQPCAAITTAALGCYSFTPTAPNVLLNTLIPGQKYYIRIGNFGAITDYIFNLCITTSVTNPLEVNPSGDRYTIDQLVKEVLIKSDCDLVSNVKYQNGDGSANTKKYNTLGYFSKGSSDFPFEEGIVLSTNEIQYVSGRYMGEASFRGDNKERWTGDQDINDAINDAGGGLLADKRVTQVEFDFIPVKETLQFEYLFASNSYHKNCGVSCHAGALFAAWLVDSTTGEGQNLAKVENTNLPIAINTIRDANKTGILSCGSVNPMWYGKHYENNQDSPLDAPIDFVGLTKPMKSANVKVVPGRKYHIKLAVMDFCTTVAHSTAVFFNSGSFDIGSLDLGPDMLVETGNALCSAESRVIKSGLGTDGAEIQWYKDDVVIPGANQAELTVTETGQYKVIGKYAEIKCEISGSIKVEVYPAISTVVSAPKSLPLCRTSLKPLTVDLTEAASSMFSKVDATKYKVTYFKTRTDATEKKDSISTPNGYIIEASSVDTMLYLLVEDLSTGCSEIFEWTLKATAGIAPVQRENVAVCASYTLPALEKNQYYYSGAAATGRTYQEGDVLTEVKTHTIYVLQDNGSGCYEEIHYTVSITEAVTAAVFDDQELECELYVLQALSQHNRYFTQSNGQGVELAVGSILPIGQTVYVYASSNDGLCTDESSFTIRYKECPIPKGISPNGDGLNDRFDLSVHGISNLVIYNRYGAEVYSFQGTYTDQWYGQGKGDKSLPDGTYYYVVVAHGKTKTGWVQINK